MPQFVASRSAAPPNSGVSNGYAIAAMGGHAQLIGNSAVALGSARGGMASFPVARSSSTSFSAFQAISAAPVASSNLLPTRSFARSFSSLMSRLVVKACDYEPDESDELDVDFAQYLKDLRPELRSALHVARQARGSYEIEGRRIRLFRELDDEEEEEGLVVQEEGTTDPDSFTPLETYLQQSAHVAAFERGHSDSTQRRQDLTFGDARIPNDTDPFTARLMCMQIACEQAEYRQNRPYEASTAPTSADLEALKESEKPRSWWDGWAGIFRPTRREDRDDDDTSEEGCV